MVRFVLSLLMILSLPAAGFSDQPDPQKWIQVDAESQIAFSVNIGDRASEGQFQTFSSDIKFDPENLSKSRILVRVDMTAIDADYQDVRNNIKTADWFDSERFPEAIFESYNIRQLTADGFQAVGNLNLKGITQQVALNFTLKEYSPPEKAVIVGQMMLKRLDFNVGQGQWKDTQFISNDVSLTVKLVAKGAGS